MKILGQATDRHGRIWRAQTVTFEEAEEENWSFWHQALTPEQRIMATLDCLTDGLKVQGNDELPRLRRVSRVVHREGS